MFISQLFLLSINLSPLIVEEATLKLPMGAKNWEIIGRFTLKDETDKDYTVRLYALDSDSVAEKASGFSLYPNAFSLYVVYRTDGTNWMHRLLYASTRVRFNKVVRTAAEVVVLEFRSNFEVDQSRKVQLPGEKRVQLIIDPAEEELRQAIAANILRNSNFTMQVRVRRGQPIAM